MNLPQSIKTCIKKFAVISGRASRSEFWYFWLTGVGVSIILKSIIANLAPTNIPPTHFILLINLISLITVIPFITVTIRRLHDVGKTGQWLIFPLILFGAYIVLLLLGLLSLAIPISFAGMISYFILLLYCCKKGDVGENKYGYDPLANFIR